MPPGKHACAPVNSFKRANEQMLVSAWNWEPDQYRQGIPCTYVQTRLQDIQHSHSIIREVLILTIFNIHRTIGMYFLVFTGNRDDSECYDLQGSYYPIQSMLPGECIGKYQTHILARKTLAMLQQWCNPPDAPVPVGRSMITSTIKSMITSTRTPVQSGE